MSLYVIHSVVPFQSQLMTPKLFSYAKSDILSLLVCHFQMEFSVLQARKLKSLLCHMLHDSGA